MLQCLDFRCAWTPAACPQVKAHLHTHTHTHTHTRTRTHTHTHKHTLTHRERDTNTHKHTHTHTQTHTCTQTHTHAHKHTHTHTHAHKHTHTRTHNMTCGNLYSSFIHRLGQNHLYTTYTTAYLVIPLPTVPYIHHIYVWFWPTLLISNSINILLHLLVL